LRELRQAQLPVQVLEVALEEQEDLLEVEVALHFRSFSARNALGSPVGSLSGKVTSTRASQIPSVGRQATWASSPRQCRHRHHQQ